MVDRENEYCVDEVPISFIEWCYIKKAHVLDEWEREFCHGDGAQGYAEYCYEKDNPEREYEPEDKLIGGDGSC